MEEFDRLDASLYDAYATGVEGDVPFYVEEARRAGSPVLEIGCGTGRITFPIAQADGCSISWWNPISRGIVSLPGAWSCRTLRRPLCRP